MDCIARAHTQRLCNAITGRNVFRQGATQLAATAESSGPWLDYCQNRTPAQTMLRLIYKSDSALMLSVAIAPDKTPSLLVFSAAIFGCLKPKLLRQKDLCTFATGIDLFCKRWYNGRAYRSCPQVGARQKVAFRRTVCGTGIRGSAGGCSGGAIFSDGRPQAKAEVRLLEKRPGRGGCAISKC
jgi:hypothetical protein